MGHSIKTGISLGTEFAMGEVNQMLYLYGSLESEEHCRYASGDGGSKLFTRCQIETAFERLRKIHLTPDYALLTYKEKFDIELIDYREDKVTVSPNGLAVVYPAPDSRSVAHKQVYLFLKDLLSKDFNEVTIRFG